MSARMVEDGSRVDKGRPLVRKLDVLKHGVPVCDNANPIPHRVLWL